MPSVLFPLIKERYLPLHKANFRTIGGKKRQRLCVARDAIYRANRASKESMSSLTTTTTLRIDARLRRLSQETLAAARDTRSADERYACTPAGGTIDVMEGLGCSLQRDPTYHRSKQPNLTTTP